MTVPETKWWGWGTGGREIEVDSWPAAWTAIRGALGLSGDERFRRPDPEDALTSTGSPSIVMCHAAHADHHGCAHSVTFLARQAMGREVEQWQTVKQAAMRALLDHGGVVSHHHRIGVDHAAYGREAVGDAGVAAFRARALKTALDPEDIMNPGKLVPP